MDNGFKKRRTNPLPPAVGKFHCLSCQCYLDESLRYAKSRYCRRCRSDHVSKTTNRHPVTKLKD